MPTTKTQKPTQSRADEPKPAPEPTREDRRRAEVHRHYEALREVRSILDVRENDLEYVEAVLLILRRDSGCTTPAEHFIASILHAYVWADDKGVGLTINHVEAHLQTFRDDLADAIEVSGYITNRYPRPEASHAE